MKGALEVGCLSLKRFTVEGLERGLLYWGPWVMKEGSGGGHLSSWGLSWAKWSGLIYWGLRRWVKRALKVGHLSVWELCEGNQEEGSLNGDPGG
jgi:hypothetical protein